MPGTCPHGQLQLELLLAQLGAGPPGQELLAQMSRDGAQETELGGQRRVAGRSGRPALQGAGARALGPREDAARPPVLDGELQTGGGELLAEHRGVGAQVGRAESRGVVGAHGKGSAQRPLGAATVVVGEPEQRLRVPPGRARFRAAGAAGDGDVGEQRPRRRQGRGLQRGARGHEPRAQAGDRPASRGAVIGSGSCSARECRAALAGVPPGERRDLSRESRPRGPALLRELGRRSFRCRTGVLGPAGAERCSGEEKPRLCGVVGEAALVQAEQRGARPVGGLRPQTRGEQRLGPVQHERAVVEAALLADFRCVVEQLEGGRHVTDEAHREAEVLPGARELVPQPVRLRDGRAAFQVVDRPAVVAEVGAHRAPVAEQAGLPEGVAVLAQSGQRLAVAREGVLVAPDPLQHQSALGQQAAQVGALEQRSRAFSLVQCVARATGVGQGHDQAHPCFAHPAGQAGGFGHLDRLGEVDDRPGQVAGAAAGQSAGAQGDGCRLVVVAALQKVVRLLEHLGRTVVRRGKGRVGESQPGGG